MTIKYFLFLIDPDILKLSSMGEPLRMDSWAALAADNSISKLEMVLSNVLQFVSIISSYIAEILIEQR